MARKPKASTLMNFASAWNKLLAVAVERGYISERVPVPKLTTKGEKGTTRPAFSEEEIVKLLAFMETWQHEGLRAVEKEMRPLLRDYVEMLVLTGMRHGTEAMGICWRHLEWHTDKVIVVKQTKVSATCGYGWMARRVGVGSLPSTGQLMYCDGYTQDRRTSVSSRLKRHLLSVCPTSCSGSVTAINHQALTAHSGG
jgi:integrase